MPGRCIVTHKAGSRRVIKVLRVHMAHGARCDDPDPPANTVTGCWRHAGADASHTAARLGCYLATLAPEST